MKSLKWSLAAGLLIGSMSAYAVVQMPPDVAAPAKAAAAPAVKPTKAAAIGFFDIRESADQAARLRNIAAPTRAALSQRIGRSGSALAALHQHAPGATVRFNAATAAPEMVAAAAVPLSAAAPGQSGEAVVRRFLSDNKALYGLADSDLAALSFIGESKSPSGLRMVRAEQLIAGKRVFLSETRFLMGADGRLWRSLGTLVPNLGAAVGSGSTAATLSAAAATASAMKSVGIDVDAGAFSNKASPSGGAQADAMPSTAHKLLLTSTDERVAGDVTAELGWFPVQPGLVVPAWRLITFTTGDADWNTIVDAESGTVLWRKNMREYASIHDARFRVYVRADGTTPASSPAPFDPSSPAAPGSGTQAAVITPAIVNMSTAQDILASPNGWINDCPGGFCTANESQTLGNNVLVCEDRVVGGNANICDTSASSVVDGSGRPTGNPDVNGRNRDFLGTTPRNFETNYLPPPQGGNPEAGQTASGNGNNGTLPVDQFRRGVMTHLFYMANWYHDQVYELGFDEAAGNFQVTNFSGMGLGNDRVLADADDGSSTNNANFSTPPDGTSGRMQMYVFTGPNIDRDGSLDEGVVLHEMTHGLSNRIVGNGAGLNWDSARGMGEGWSDFYALSLVNNTNGDDPAGRYPAGAYATYKLSGLAYLDNYVYGIRRFPYVADKTVNPFTWADVDDVTNDLSGGIAPTAVTFNLNGAAEVHNIGEVWAETLWDVRARVIADPAGANGNVPTGNRKVLQIVTDGLKLTPLNPSFTDARDAILAADCATNACANESFIWDGFANRGLGYGAADPYNIMGRYSTSHVAVQESFSAPFLDVVDAATDVTVDDSFGNNNGAIDPGEALKLTVKLSNPWRGKNATGATATLSTGTPGVTIWDAGSSYGAIAAQGSATGDSFGITLDPAAACASAIDFTLTTVSNLGTTAASFRVRVGAANGTDPVVTYSSSPSLTILNARPRGVFDQMAVSDDFQIADLNFRVDNINASPGVGDLSVMLRSPSGIGTDLVTLIDGLNDVGGTSITNMVIDGDVANDAAHDMVQATAANAPYTGSWQPVYNAPWAALVNPALPADAVDNMSRYKGLSTKGTWSALAADVFSVAQGGAADGNSSFSGWSLLVTPTHFDCSAVAPDNTPAAPVFTALSGAPLSTLETSNEVTLSGFNQQAPITFRGVGAYSVNGGTYTSADGIVLPGDKVKIRLTSSTAFKTSVHGGVSINGASGAYSVTTVAADSVPDPIVFSAVTGAALSTVYSSNTVSVSGLESGYTQTPITVTGGSYSLNGGAFVTTAGIVQNGDTVQVQLTSSAGFQTRLTATLRVGTANSAFAVTTRAADTTPDAIVFTAVTGADFSTVYTSNTVSIGGLESGYTQTPISITGGSYSLNGGGFVTTAGAVQNGDTVAVRVTSAATAVTRKAATLRVGAAGATYAVTTRK